MQRSPRRKKLKKEEPPAPAVMSRRDRLILFAWIAGALAVMLGYFHFYSTIKWSRHLDQMLNRWRATYHLSHEQAERVRSIERKFHGSGNPFLDLSHTAEELRAHDQELAAVMNPADGERFLQAQEERKKHR